MSDDKKTMALAWSGVMNVGFRAYNGIKAADAPIDVEVPLYLQGRQIGTANVRTDADGRTVITAKTTDLAAIRSIVPGGAPVSISCEAPAADDADEAKETER